LITGLLGLGSTSLAIKLANYRWIFLLISVASLVVGFYYNVARLSSRRARVLFWLSSLFTVATVAHWGWWRF